MLADGTRVRLLWALRDAERSVNELAATENAEHASDEISSLVRDAIEPLEMSTSGHGHGHGPKSGLWASLTHASTPHSHGAATLASLPGGIDVRASACAWIGHQISAEAERDVDPSTSLAEAHSFAHRSEAEPVRTTPR